MNERKKAGTDTTFKTGTDNKCPFLGFFPLKARTNKVEHSSSTSIQQKLHIHPTQVARSSNSIPQLYSPTLFSNTFIQQKLQFIPLLLDEVAHSSL